MSFPAYDNTKPSGVAWIGDIPVDWDVIQGRRLFTQKRDPSEPDDEQLSATQKYGVLPQSKFMDLEDKKVTLALTGLEGFKQVLVDDFVISLRSFQGGIEHSQYSGCASPAYTILRPNGAVHPPFWKYLLKSVGYIEALQSVTDGIRDGKNISYEQFGKVFVPDVPPDEQKAISSFLDVETSKIDGLVSQQRRLIELLKEKRQAVISHAVTKGLNPNAPMKPSGIQWLGDVPQHWSVVTVRRVLSAIEQGWSPQCDSRPASEDEWGILKTGCVNRGVFCEIENKALPDDLEPIVEYEVKSGDVLMSRASGSPELVGATAFVYEVRPHLMLSDKTFRIHLAETMEPKFFVALLNSQLMRSQIEQSISGAEGLANNLPQSKLRCFVLALPPVTEQREIVQELRSRCEQFDSLVAEAERAIELLQERRTALISAAVTGKIDVREFAQKEAMA